jgi:5-(carboxyamino)imidazole ribonucleotide mutase
MAGGVPVAICMGSQSDWPTMRCAAEVLDALQVAYDPRIVSAHRTPERMYEFGRSAADQGFRVIIAGAGGAAHLPGMLAA